MTADPTGQRFHLRGPHSSAEITQVGAALRALTVKGVDLVPGYPDDVPTPAASGVVLVPWPNRIRDGKYAFDGQDLQLAISEPKFGNASHGLLRFGIYQPVEHTDERLVLAADVVPQTGYPFHLRTRVTYTLQPDGLHVEHRIENIGAAAAPVALGIHPYLQIGGVATEDLVIHSTGTTTLVVDERNIPIDEVPVSAANDLRAGRRLGDATLDNGYRGLERDAEGRARHTLTAPDGRRLELWQDRGFRWVQVFTTDRYPGRSLAVAIEPMTAPANAFATGTDLETLQPGAELTGEWGIRFS
ncbi:MULTISPECIES: aldose 1-epimerase family protein [Microbacterium]|uniref:aldose 1-epimerase family protein n=1 Tax=Microbacterium TaxID=33882 RepID=UPI0027850296|nr:MULTISPECIES: aldose 1-epimerase family protein [Microbacterium]MDQ1082700.1 aldose 1-epimerase [Microbacterium sp. SORGH_AS_0344]MDQ1168530.1 aldose 1-epimerase [Microbacterium proteolyticum]